MCQPEILTTGELEAKLGHKIEKKWRFVLTIDRIYFRSEGDGCWRVVQG